MNKTVQNTNNNTDELEKKLEALLGKAEEVNKKIDETSQKASEKVENFEREVTAGVAEIDQICSELDAADQKAEDEMDALMIKRAEEMAQDEANEIADLTKE